MKRNPLIGKRLTVGIILLFVVTCIIPAIAQNAKKPSLLPSKGDWLYVGGSGPGNYTTIQDAIDNSSEGETIFVYNGIYIENITVHKSIHLIGESMMNTILQELDYERNIVTVTAEQVNISRFTIQGDRCWEAISLLSSNNTISKLQIFVYHTGIFIHPQSSHNLLYENRIINSGIHLEEAHNNIIENNYLEWSCISLYNSNYNDIVDNYITTNYFSIDAESSSYNIIENNYITGIGTDSISVSKNLDLNKKNSDWNKILNNTVFNCYDGLIRVQGANHTLVMGNNLSYNTNGGILLTSSFDCNVSQNSIYDNGIGINMVGSQSNILYRNNIEKIRGNGLSFRWSEYNAENNNIIENTISKCNTGLYLMWVKNNTFLRNNFLNNKNETSCEYDCMNIWNDNHLGNYWDSYCGLDFDGDGIGDKPKNIKGDNNPDNCPLMAPYCLKTSVRIKVPQQGNIYLRNLPIASYPSTIVFGNIKIIANAANYINLDINIKKVEFYIDGLLRHIDRWPPFSWRWIVSSHIKHNHTITVIAYDSVGNKSTDELQLIRFL